jgi:signal transduction histidine kinase/ActR/RegA family two-component response regulator
VAVSPDSVAVDPPAADFRLLFEAAPALFLVLDPQLRIVAASDAYLAATMTTREDVTGRGIFDVFPDNPDEAEATGVSNLRGSLHRVRDRLAVDTMAVQKYDVQRPAEQGGGFEVRYWSPRNSPVLGVGGRLAYIIHRVEDVTEFVRSQQEGSEAQQQTAVLRRRTDRMQAEILRGSEELRQANVALRAADQAKNEFLSRASHELRTPLNAILGFSDLLSIAPLEGEYHDWVTLILKAGRHLLALLNDVLDISRIDGGHLSMSVEPVALAPLLADALDLVRPLAQTHGVCLSAPPPQAEELYVAADRQRLRQVLLNLLSNAVKYNHPTGTVAVTVNDEPPDRIRIGVTDTGRGIPEAAMARLFTPFERLDAAQTGVEGTGLGLALSRHLMQDMNGDLDVTSTPGEGSTFSIDLPTAQPPGADQPTDRPDQVHRRAYAGPRRILYVEDMVENVRLVEQILTHRPSITLIPAMLAGIALDLAREHHPDLILLDLHLPDMPGEEVLRLLRADPTLRDIPVLILSADATQHQVNQLQVAGTAGYLTKPIAVRELLQALDDILDQHLPTVPSTDS